MEKANKKAMYESLLLHEMFNNELNAIGTDIGYSRYHSNCAEGLRYLSDKYNQILGYTGTTTDDFVNFISATNLTSEQRRELVQLRRDPMFKRVMGETALSKKAELENLLGVKITSQGPTIAGENGLTVSVKSVDVLDKEINDYSDKLTELFGSGQITEEQYDSYNQILDYIFDYYISQSRGEQIPLRKLSDKEYENIESMANYNGISYDEQVSKLNEDMKFELENVQEAAQSMSNRYR